MIRCWRAGLGIALIACVAVSCDTDVDSDEPDAEVVSPACMEAESHSDLEFIQAEVFDTCAAFAVCHQGAAASALMLNLEDGNSEANLVGVPARTVEASGFDLVVAGDSNSSYLMVILGHIAGPVSDRGTMPLNSALLCVQKREAIERWINSLTQ